MSQHAGLCSRPCASGGGRAEEGGRGPGQGAGEAQACACAHASGHAFSPGAHGMAHCCTSVWKYDAPARWERCAPGVRAFDTLESLIPVGDSCLWLPGVAKGRARRGATCASSAPPPAFLFHGGPCSARLSASLDCASGGPWVLHVVFCRQGARPGFPGYSDQCHSQGAPAEMQRL